MAALRPIAVVHFICTASLLAAASLAMAAGPVKASDVEQKYQKERAACLAGDTNQDRAVCLREAGAARQEALKGNLDGAAANYEQNQLERCKALPADEQVTCRERMRAGAASGSAQQGGIYRELTTVEPAAASKPAPAARTN